MISSQLDTLHEKVRGRQLSIAQLSSFNRFIDQCSLSDIRSSGNKWSPHNSSFGSNRILGRLDRVLCNQHWIALLPESFYKYLSISTSDHTPILLHLLPNQDAGPKQFRFFNYWMELSDFHITLNRAWNSEVSGNPIFQLVTELKTVKQARKSWLKEENILPRHRTNSIRQRLLIVHEEMSTNPTGVFLRKEEYAKRRRALHMT